jgi:hypothetical protein
MSIPRNGHRNKTRKQTNKTPIREIKRTPHKDKKSNNVALRLHNHTKGKKTNICENQITYLKIK